MTDRRYSDDEIAEIFKRAAEAEPAPLRAAGGGLLLTELQSIGAEVGIPADRVAQAARSLELTPKPASMGLIGLPIGVRDAVELGRKLSEDEWNAMVVAARETFAAKGRLRAEGDFREWTNGNLAMLLEPSGTGHRIRFQTLNQSAEGMLMLGIGTAGFGAVLAAIGAFVAGSGGSAMVTAGPTFLGIGAVLAVLGGLRLPSWAKKRREQMRQLGETAKGMVDHAKG